MFLSLKGALGTVEEIELDKCLNHADKFERGHEDIFELRLPPLGDLLGAKIMHDNSGLTNPDVRCPVLPPFVSAFCDARCFAPHSFSVASQRSGSR